MDELERLTLDKRIDEAVSLLMNQIDDIGGKRGTVMDSLIDLVISDERGYAWERGILRLATKLGSGTRERIEKQLIEEEYFLNNGLKAKLLMLIDKIMMKYDLTWEALAPEIKNRITN